MKAIENEKLETLMPSAGVTGTVKWYDAKKGFGFVVVPGYDGDFLLHENILANFGRSSIAEGSSVEFVFDQTATGLKIVELISIAPPDETEHYPPEEPVDHLYDTLVPARVKWFDKNKGYGFVNEFGSVEDIFIGIGVLRRSSRKALQNSEAICIQIAERAGRKTVHRVYDWSSPMPLSGSSEASVRSERSKGPVQNTTIQV